MRLPPPTPPLPQNMGDLKPKTAGKSCLLNAAPLNTCLPLRAHVEES